MELSMKKLTILFASIITLMSVSSTFAAIQIGMTGRDQNPPNGADYTGVIKSAVYVTKDPRPNHNVPYIYVITSGDKKNSSNFFSIGLNFDGNDLAFGETLANSIGKKITIPGGRFELYDDVSNITLSSNDYPLSTNDLAIMPQK